MQIRVLGCSGAIGDDARTTSFLVDDDVLVDAGTGVGDLTLEEMRKIEHIFLTHSHLDHIACMPLLLDSVANERTLPVTIHARAETIEALRKHIFNWQIWPDFTTVPTPENPFAVYKEMEPGSICEIDGRSFQSIDVNHTVPSVAYIVSCEQGAFAFSGDTSTTDEFWAAVNRQNNMKYIVVETTFEDSERELTNLSKHLCPELVTTELGKLSSDAAVYITHLMPGRSDQIMKQIADHVGSKAPVALQRGHIFSL